MVLLCLPAVLFVWERGPRIGLFWDFDVVLCVFNFFLMFYFSYGLWLLLSWLSAHTYFFLYFYHTPSMPAHSVTT